MSRLDETGLHCKSIGNIPLIIVAGGKEAFYSPDNQVKWLQM